MRRLRRVVLPSLLALVLLACSPAATPTPTPPPTPRPVDYTALEVALEAAVEQGYAEDHVRAVLVSVDGQTRIAHYRHGFTATDHSHVFSVTKSVLSILIGIAIGDGLIADVDQRLGTLLPKHRDVMSEETAQIKLRDVMAMSAGFQNEITGGLLWDEASKPGQSYVDYILRGRTAVDPGRTFVYADVSAHIASAVLATALQRGGRASSVLDFAREKLFEPLGIRIGPGWHKPLPDVFDSRFGAAGFGWGTDPNRVELGGYGLRLTAPDMVKIGELCRGDGNWHGKQVVPAGGSNRRRCRPRPATTTACCGG